MKKNTLILFLAAQFLGCCLLPHDDNLVIMTWNVQNLFDDVSQGSEYAEFNPEKGSWNSGLYHLKLSAIAEVIKSPAAGDPDLVLLQEVENTRVVEDLLEIYLGGQGYRFYDVSNEDYGAVHTVLLSRYPLNTIQSHAVWGPGLAEQRYIMEYSCIVNEKEIGIFNNHWKSKAGSSSGFTERGCAAQVLERCSSAACKMYDILVAGGDFNCEYADFELSGLAWKKPENGDGSYAFRDEWETIDMLLLSDKSLNKLVNLKYVNEDFMLNSKGYPLPFNANSGKGYSDHLPLFAVFDLR